MVYLKMKNKFVNGALAFFAGGIFAIGAGLFGAEVVSKIEDRFRDIPQENRLEEVIKKPIYFNFNSGDEKRQNLVREFGLVYNLARKNWDNFDEQWDLVKNVRLNVDSESPKRTGRTDRFDRLHLTLYGDQREAIILIHELAHIWERNKTDQRFSQKWQALSKGEYTPDWKNASFSDVIKNGSVSYYSMKSIHEDIATICEFVFALNSPHIFVGGYPNTLVGKDFYYRDFITSSISHPKIREKLKLLRNYDFFSEREYRITLDEMAED